MNQDIYLELQKQTRSQERHNIISHCRLAFPEIADTVEIVETEIESFVFNGHGLVTLRKYRFPIHDYFVEFTAAWHKISDREFLIIKRADGFLLTLTQEE